MADDAGRAASPPPAWRILRRIGRRFYRISNAHRLLLAQAIVWLALARLALLVVPFQQLAKRFGKMVPPGAGNDAQPALSAAQFALAQNISWAITRAARYVPFRAVCLPQAIAAQTMLRRRGIASVMHFGVLKKPGEELAAHAWLNAAQIEVTGYPLEPDYVEMARFL
jgi:hypothetical protein